MAMLISREKGRWHGLWTQVRTGLRRDTRQCSASSGTITAGDSVVTRQKRSPQTRVPARGILPQSQDRPESPTEESHGFSRGRMSIPVSRCYCQARGNTQRIRFRPSCAVFLPMKRYYGLDTPPSVTDGSRRPEAVNKYPVAEPLPSLIPQLIGGSSTPPATLR